MLNWIHDRFYFLLLLSDLVLTEGALLLAEAMRFGIRLGKPLGPEQAEAMAGIAFVVPAIWFISFRITRVYQRGILVNLHAQVRELLAGIAMATISFGGFLYLAHHDNFSRLMLLYFVLLDGIFLTGLRCLGYRMRKFDWAGRYLDRRVLVVGYNELGLRVAKRLHNGSPYGLRIIGFARDGNERPGPAERPPFPILGSYRDLPAIVGQHQVDAVVITTLPQWEAILSDVEDSLRSYPVTVQVAAEAFLYPDRCIPLETIRGIDLVAVQGPALSLMDQVEKRLVDLVGATAGLLVSLVLWPIIALLIKIDSPGPIFFIQQRIGKDGHPFSLIKFRSMVMNAEDQLGELINLEELDQPAFKIRGDPRVTRIGRILRRSGLDEVPQLLNVLKGDMSLVGPRPEEERIVKRYSRWHRQRLLVKPGMTGPMQVNGRGELTMDERIRLELGYIRNYSLLEDLRLLLSTVPAVLKGKGAF